MPLRSSPILVYLREPYPLAPPPAPLAVPWHASVSRSGLLLPSGAWVRGRVASSRFSFTFPSFFILHLSLPVANFSLTYALMVLFAFCKASDGNYVQGLRVLMPD